MTIEVTDAGRNEYEALVRDAKRYRWLRDDPPVGLSVRSLNRQGEFIYVDGSVLDRAVDAEMEQGK